MYSDHARNISRIGISLNPFDRSDHSIFGFVLAGIAMKADPFAILPAGQPFLAAPEIYQIVRIDQR